MTVNVIKNAVRIKLSYQDSSDRSSALCLMIAHLDIIV